MVGRICPPPLVAIGLRYLKIQVRPRSHLSPQWIHPCYRVSGNFFFIFQVKNNAFLCKLVGEKSVYEEKFLKIGKICCTITIGRSEQYLDLKAFCYNNDQKCHNICFFLVKNIIDLIKRCLRSVELLFNKFNEFKCRIFNFDEFSFTPS